MHAVINCSPTTHSSPQGDSMGLSYSISEVEALQTLDGQQVPIEEPLFSIEASTGVISLNGSLERERGFHYYEIIVSGGCRV